MSWKKIERLRATQRPNHLIIPITPEISEIPEKDEIPL